MLQTRDAVDGLKRGLEIEVKDGGRDPAAAGGAGRRRRRGDDPRPVRQRGLVGAVPVARRRAGRRGPVAGGAGRQGRQAAAAARGARCSSGAQTAGVASALAGRRPGRSIAAVVPVSAPPQGRADVPDARASPSTRGELQKATGAPMLLSDGHAARLRSAGSAAQQAALARLVGKESTGSARDPDGGWLALATPLAPKLWLWVLHTRRRRAGVGQPRRCAVGGGDRARPGRPCSSATGGGAPRKPAVAAGRGGVPSARGGRVARLVRHGAGEIRGAGRSLPDHRDWATVRRSSPKAAALPAARRHLDGRERGAGRRCRRRVFPSGRASRPGRARSVATGCSSGWARAGWPRSTRPCLHGAEGFRRVFVVKRLRPHVARNRAAVEQFIDEAKLGSSLVHSNIVPVFDFGKVGDEYFMAQEYIVGRDLSRLLNATWSAWAPLDRAVGAYIAHEVLEALAYAHSRTDADGNPIGLVHRDISPGNIMLDLARRGEAVRLRHREGGGARVEDRGRRGEGERLLHVARAGARAGRSTRAPICFRSGW